MQMAGAVKHYLAGAGSAQWAVRRRLVIVTVGFCFGMIIWAAGWMRIETAPTIIQQCFMLIMAVIPTYLFGVVVDEHMKRKSLRGKVDDGVGTDAQLVEETTTRSATTIKSQPHVQDLAPEGEDDPASRSRNRE